MDIMLKLNSVVKVKINSIGLTILKRKHDDIWRGKKEFVAPVVDENGYTEMKLWDVMMGFGDSVFYEGTLEDERWIPIDPVILIDEDNYKIKNTMALKKSK